MNTSTLYDDYIQVAVRVRPHFSWIGESSEESCVQAIEDNGVIALKSPENRLRSYNFDHTFGELTTQDQLFTTLGRSIVEAFVEGYNGTIFAYGQTGSGKTYTMLGPDSDATNFGGLFENRGLIPRCVEYIFDLLKKRDDMVKYSLKCSFVELYNEAFYDLLNLKKSDRLKLRSPNSQTSFVEGATEKEVQTAKEILDVVQTGWSNRRVAEHAMNRESSRSHAIFIIYMEASEQVKNGINKKHSKLHLIDLAGSERQKSSKSEGERLKEACHINSSLFNLGRVIRLIGGKPPYVSYRDTLLTQLLRDALGGNSRTAVIVNVHPNKKFFEETHSTIKFAKELKKVKNKAKINQEFFCELKNLTREYETEDKEVQTYDYDKIRINELEEDNEILKRKLQEHRDAISQLLKLNCELEEKLEEAVKFKEPVPVQEVQTKPDNFPTFEAEIFREQLLELITAFSTTKYELEGEIQFMKEELESTRNELDCWKSSSKTETFVVDVDTKPLASKLLENGLDALEIDQELAKMATEIRNSPASRNRNDRTNRSARPKNEFESRRKNRLFSSLMMRP